MYNLKEMKKLIILTLLILAVLIITILWWENGIRPVNSQNKTPIIFVVKKGEGVREIANNLKTKGLIRDPIVFFLITKTGFGQANSSWRF